MSKTSFYIDNLNKMKAEELVDDALYFKCLVEIGYSFLRDGDLNACLEMICKCEPEYFKTTQIQQMHEDPTYKEMVVYMAGKFIQYGLVEAQLDQPTKGIGNA